MGWKSKEARNAYQLAYRRARGVLPRKVRIPVSCKICTRPIPQQNRVYCSFQCQQVDAQSLIDRWLAGAFNPPNHGEGRVPEYIVRWWTITYGWQCFQCGWAEVRRVDGRIPLTWDHVDGDCTNNRYGNVRLLCPNCHALTDTYGSLNKQSRRKRW